MKSKVSAISYGIVNRFSTQASSHYYFGLSVSKLAFHRFLRFLIYFADFSFNTKNFKRLELLKNSKIEKSAILCATGKSLDNLTKDFIDKKSLEIWAVNDFYLTEFGQKCHPQFYCFSDPTDLLRINDLKKGKEISDYLTNCKTTLVVPDSWNSDNEIIKDAIFYNDRQHFRTSGKIDPTKPRKFISITLYKALNVMQYLGYREIYIIGFDGSEFYGYYSNIQNEIFQDYYKTHARGINNKQLKLHEATSGMAGRMQSLSRLYGDLFLFDKSRIINLNPESLIDVFDKKNLN